MSLARRWAAFASHVVATALAPLSGRGTGGRDRTGRSTRCRVGENHWHGPNRFTTHLAMLHADDDGNSATWGDHVTDVECKAAPTS
jgi:hypothetical protein